MMCARVAAGGTSAGDAGACGVGWRVLGLGERCVGGSDKPIQSDCCGQED